MPQNEVSHVTDDAVIISQDFFQGDIDAGLERMRKRLLDLSNRNRLLNFKHTKTSSLRVVDEIPDFLYERLVNGREMSFRPVPNPKKREIDEAGGLRNVDVASFAEKIGIKTSYELEHIAYSGNADTPRNLVDGEIQTLHFPEKLEAIVGRIGNTARLAIEETGTNMLYLVFGYLEWYESNDSDISHLAPLFLLPVSLRRGDSDSQTRTFKYYLSYSGEDILANISLQEKMKSEFGIEIPDINEDDTPESYFSKFTPIFRTNERWEIHRFVTLTLLSFGKLLMYRDLDSANWPSDSKISTHPRIKEFFEGIQNGELIVAADYELDENDSDIKPPLLIDNADSSQHSVIIDALKGNNLVVEGPPGTGKSQTITNLIASALTLRKSVLFVSEKLAALEVVRRRLDKAGLGTFCLELHSNKTKKQELLHDIQRRIELRNSYEDPSQIDAKIQLLENQKTALHAYAKLIGQTFGKANIRIYDLFWRRQTLLRETCLNGSVLNELRVLDAKSLDNLEIESRKYLVNLFSTHFQNILGAVPKTSGEASISDHPWWGMTNTEATFVEQDEIMNTLLQQSAVGHEIIGILTELSSKIEGNLGLDWRDIVGSTFAKIKGLVASVQSLNHLDGEVNGDTLFKLANQDFTHHLRSLIDDIEKYRQIYSTIFDIFGSIPDFSQDDIASIKTKIVTATEFTNGTTILSDLFQLANQQEAIANRLSKASDVASEINATLKIENLQTKEGLDTLVQILQAINLAPIDQLHLRHRGLTSDGAVSVISRAIHDVEPIIAARKSLNARLNLDFAPSKSLVIEYISACANSRWYKPFDKKYKEAKSAHAALSKEQGKHRKGRIWEDFQALVEYQTREEAFCANERFQKVFGPNFAGVNTEFNEHVKLGVWLNLIRQILPTHGDLRTVTANHLWELGSPTLASFFGDKQVEPKALLLDGIEACDLATQIVSNSFNDRSASLTSISTYLKSCSEKAKDLAESLVSIGVPKNLSLDDVFGILDKYEVMKVLRVRIDSDKTCGDLLNNSFDGVQTDTKLVANTVLFFQSIETSGLPVVLKRWLETPEIAGRLFDLRRVSTELDDHLRSFISLQSKFSEIARLNYAHWYLTDKAFEDVELEYILSRTDRSIAGSKFLSDWVQYQQIREKAAQIAKAASIIEFVEDGKIEPHLSEKAFHLAVFQVLIDDVFIEHPSLVQFSGISHNQIRQKFAELDKEVLYLYQKRAAYLVDKHKVPIGNGKGAVSTFTEASLLIREIQKQKRHIPIRQLILRAGNALQALKPCFMMGPLSVAQYLPPGRFVFDYVIMDEASQLKPEDALGAIARGKQIIIVGDRKQLPPTSFFDQIGDETDDDDDNLAQSLEDAESILDVASAIYQPSRMLKWHYRSRHASLIAFSNQQFYDNKLIVFPSPLAKDPLLGVQLRRVTDGIYQDRRNWVEGRQLIEEVMRHMEKNPDTSLGVVTLNSVQRDLVDDLFNEKLKENIFAEEFLARMSERSEPFFLKNLENVQGDERDVIFVSITFGPNEQGRVYQRFGPINSITGHRRLNVLFTRARRQVVVFSSMTPDQIITAPDSKLGVKALKSYLEFASTGILEAAQFSGREPDSDFEVEVATALKEHGYETVAQVGVAGFFIDLAVKHPSKNDAFILGIECDGATYHSSRSARDRDRLREEILTDLGWKLHRIWSTDWFRNKSQEIQRMVNSIRSAIAADS